MNPLDSHLLSLVIFLPLAGALVCAVLPRGEGGQHKAVALVTSLLTFLASLLLWSGFSAQSGKYAFEQRTEWAKSLGSSYHVGVDGVALLLLMLTTFLSPIVIASAWKFTEKNVKLFAIALLVLETAMLGTLCALDLMLFYVFWEAMLIPMYLLIGIWGSERRIYAAVKFFLFTFIGSVLMLVAIFYLWSKSGTGPARTFDYPEILASTQLPPDIQFWLFLAFALAFAIKVPIFPLHTWLPDAHTEAPAAGSVLLAGVMLKLGTFGFIRYAMPLFPEAARSAAPVIAVLGVVGIIYGSLMCMAQTDLKRLIAYSSVAHLGVVMLGLSALTAEAVSGAVMQMVNHGISTGALFLVIGMLYERTHTRELSAYGGLAKITPALAAVFLVITLSSMGLPGTNGFIGEFLVLIGTYGAQLHYAELLSVFASTGVILGAVYMLWMYQKVMLGPVTRPANNGLKDLDAREWASLSPLLLAIVVIGVHPQPMLDAMKSPVSDFISRVSGVRPVGGGAVRPPAPRGTLIPAQPGGTPPRLQIQPDGQPLRPFFPDRAPLARPAPDNGSPR